MMSKPLFPIAAGLIAAGLIASGCAAPAAEPPANLVEGDAPAVAEQQPPAPEDLTLDEPADALDSSPANDLAPAPATDAGEEAKVEEADSGSGDAPRSTNAESAMVFSQMKGKEMPNVNAGIIEPTDPATIALGQGTPQFLDFFGFWCGICTAMAPAVTATKATYEGPVQYVHLDVDDPANAALLQQFGVTGTPTFVVLDGQGEVVEQWRGRVDPAVIEAALAAVVAGAPEG